MIDIKSKSKVNIHWKVSPYDYSREKENSILSKASHKYGLPKNRIKVIPEFLADKKDDSGSVYDASEVIQNIQNPQFQLKLFKEYLELNKIEDYDFELIKDIDSEINAKIDYQIYDKYRRYSIKWIKWDNFLSYGTNNYFDFSTIKNLVLLSGEPANQSGKTTFAIDLLHFLLFGKTTKVATQDKIFNKHIKEATSVVVEGCITIDGTDYVIKRTLTRPALAKRSDKSKTTQKVEYYKIVGDSKEELEDYVDNQQEENSIQTNKVIKEAIGKESDFDLIMSITESSLDDLVNKKETERGRLLSRWIGLLPLEEKDALAREKFNSDVKPTLLSNQYNTETMMQEISAFEFSVKNLEESTKKYKKENTVLDKDIEKLENSKKVLMESKSVIDENVLKIDITTLNRKIENNIAEGKQKGAHILEIDNKIKEIGDIEFSVAKYDELQNKVNECGKEIAIITERYKNISHNIQHLKTSEICPTCGRKLDNVDNSAKIKELEAELEKVVSDGKVKRSENEKLSAELESMKKDREQYTIKSQLTITRSALEVNVERLRNEYKDNMSIKMEYEKNSEAIDRNNKIEIEIRNTDTYIKSKRTTKDMNLAYIVNNENEIKHHNEQIKVRKEIIEKIKIEEKIIRNWKIYLELVGKNGISKMVLRKTLPIINARLSQLLGDVCDFDVEVGINQKNDVMFYLIKDGVYSDLSSGSGFELTASALALRAVLADMSTIPRCSYVTYDEVWGRVSKENYDNMKNLLDKIAKSYDAILLISHIDEIKEWCQGHIVVKKEDNISKITYSSSAA